MSGKDVDEIAGTLIYSAKSLDPRYIGVRWYVTESTNGVCVTDYSYNPDTKKWYGGMTWDMSLDVLKAMGLTWEYVKTNW